jgi:hypothetical protein
MSLLLYSVGAPKAAKSSNPPLSKLMMLVKPASAIRFAATLERLPLRQ